MTPPLHVVLRLDERKLPAEVFDGIVRHGGFVVRDERMREERRREAWENFGKAGRDPDSLGTVLDAIAGNGRWRSQLKLAQLRDHWDQVVGPGIAMHSRVVSFADGVLVIQAESMAWATQLTYLVPRLKDAISGRVQGLDVREIRVTGPRPASRRYR